MNIHTKLKKQSKSFNFELNGVHHFNSKQILERAKIGVLVGIDKSKNFQIFEVTDGIVRLQKPNEIFELNENCVRRFLVQEGKKCYSYNFLNQQSHWGRSEINESELRFYHNVPDNKEIYRGLITSTEEVNGNNVAIKMKIKRVTIPRNSTISLKGKTGINLGYNLT